VSEHTAADEIFYGELWRGPEPASAAVTGTPRIKKLSTDYRRLDLLRWISRSRGFCGGPSWIARGDFPSASWTEAPDQQADAGNLAAYHELIDLLERDRAAAGLGPKVSFEAEPRKRKRKDDILRRGFDVYGARSAATVNAEALEAALRICAKAGAEPERWHLVDDAAGHSWVAGYAEDQPLIALRSAQ
jgi:hypothetical protein